MRRPVRVDYLALEARNQSLGKAGEELVLRVEMDRLRREGASRLADRIEHVSHTRGDGLGYDVLSFESTGRERLIEVKTRRSTWRGSPEAESGACDPAGVVPLWPDLQDEARRCGTLPGSELHPPGRSFLRFLQDPSPVIPPPHRAGPECQR